MRSTRAGWPPPAAASRCASRARPRRSTPSAGATPRARGWRASRHRPHRRVEHRAPAGRFGRLDEGHRRQRGRLRRAVGARPAEPRIATGSRVADANATIATPDRDADPRVRRIRPHRAARRHRARRRRPPTPRRPRRAPRFRSGLPAACPTAPPSTIEATALTGSTFTDGGGYLADATGGIAVLLDSGSFARAERVLVTGTIDDRFAQRTLRASTVAVHPGGEPPTPAPIATGAVNEGVEGRLVRVAATIDGGPTALSGGVAFDVDDGSGVARVVVGSATGIDVAGWVDGRADHRRRRGRPARLVGNRRIGLPRAAARSRRRRAPCSAVADARRLGQLIANPDAIPLRICRGAGDHRRRAGRTDQRAPHRPRRCHPRVRHRRGRERRPPGRDRRDPPAPRRGGGAASSAAS